VSQYLDLINGLVHNVLLEERKRQDEIKFKLIAQNHELGGHRYGFYFKSVLFLNVTPRYARGEPIKEIHLDLKEQAQSYWEMQAKLGKDERKLRQALSIVCAKCQSSQDLRDVLPDVLVNEIPEFKRHPRKNPTGFLLENHPLLHPQYLKAMEIAEYYTALRLIF
jgi:hypothetical protein